MYSRIRHKQIKFCNEPFDSPTSPPKCEEWILYVSDALYRWNINKEGAFIVIIRPANNESRRVTPKRIKIINDFISSLKFEGELVFAEGKKNTDEATIDLYVEGKLLYKLPLIKNGNPEFRNCQAA